MRTDHLIQGLVADLPTAPGSVARIIATSLSLALAFSLSAMLLWLGPRPELIDAMHSPPFWLKAGYTFAIGTAGLMALERLGRPGTEAKLPAVILAVVFASIASAAILEMVMATSNDRGRLWLGNSAAFCPWAIIALSIPLLTAAFLALRQLAPTRYPLAGAAAGLTAGGYGACIYSLHCTEYAMSFLASWYSLGVLLVAAAGALLSGLLRW